MNGFTISPTLNKNKVFLLQKSEVEKRLDPIYYAHEFNEYDKKLSKKSFKKFHELLKSVNNGYDFRDYKESGTPYLKVANVKQGEFDFRKLQYIGFNSSEISKNIQLKKGNILLTRKGTFGNAIALDKDYDYVISSEVFYIELKDQSINPKFLEIFFNSKIGQAQFDKNKIGAIMGSLSQEAIRDLKIPFPKIEIQNEVVNIYSKYLQQKEKNEATAEKLLASIDDYLLNELGITLPAPPENILKNRIFTTTIKTISGDRFDPLYHQGSIYGGLEKSKFKYKNFKEISKYFINGFAAGKQDQNIFAEGIIQIRPTNISDEREFIFNKNIYIDLSRKNDLKNELLCKNEVLFNNTNSQELVGKTCVFNLEGDYFCSNHITRIGLHEEYISDYVGVILNLYQKNKVFYKSCINWNNQSGINLDILKTIKIPIPPLDKQKKIAEHISAIRKEAQQLKDKTKEELKKASKEIEKILLTQ